jgi:sulfoxide reductase heme-binding subunit YedZ
VKLHRLVYLSAICGVVHFLWLVKADLREPLIYAAIVATLLCARLFGSAVGLRPRSGARPPPGEGGSGQVVPDAEQGAGQRGQRAEVLD